MNNYLDHSARRVINSCNFNQHIRSAHPDRVMDEHDLIYIKEGTWNLGQDGHEYEVRAGDVILLQSGHHHYGTKPCDGVVKTCFVHFSGSEKDFVGAPGSRTENAWVFPAVTHCQNDPMVEHYFNRIIYTYWSESDYAAVKASAYLDLLLWELSSVKEGGEKAASIVEDMKLQMKKNPGRFISNAEFAGMYCCSVRTIASKFKESTGTSVHAWQMRLKCRMADELLQHDPSITLKEIAANYGFYDEYHFSKCFKKLMGHSPKSQNKENKQ